LADFGLSRRIEDATNQKSSLYGVIPYIDPKRLENLSYKFNEKSDVYSVGVLLWEMSSGQPPFYNENYHHQLIVNILQGLRETPISDPDIPSDYIKLYTSKYYLIISLLLFI
jgi:serine/threonine protein kinase